MLLLGVMFLEFNESHSVRKSGTTFLSCALFVPQFGLLRSFICVSDMSLAVRNFPTVPRWWISFDGVRVLFCLFLCTVHSLRCVCVCKGISDFSPPWCNYCPRLCGDVQLLVRTVGRSARGFACARGSDGVCRDAWGRSSPLQTSFVLAAGQRRRYEFESIPIGKILHNDQEIFLKRDN